MCAVVNSIKWVVCVPSSFLPHDAKTPRSPLAPAEKGARGLCTPLCPGFWEGFLAQEQCQACAGSVPRRGTAPDLINPAALRLAEGRVNVVVSPYAASLICNQIKGPQVTRGKAGVLLLESCEVCSPPLAGDCGVVPSSQASVCIFFHVFPPLNSRVNT